MAASPSSVLVTGAAGFIGAALCQRLLAAGHTVIGLDNLSDYYSPALKRQRLAQIANNTNAATNWHFHELCLTNLTALQQLVLNTKPTHLIHLAAQASVRYGYQNQSAYLENNLVGHFHVLQACKALTDAGQPQPHLLYASSSSVYGANETYPFTEADDVSRPLSLYAATKRANELVTHAWCHQFGLPATGLRFFTVYGPWGRPDMAPMLFAAAITEGQPIPLFNHGDLWRDFTYIDDIIEAIVRLMPQHPAAAPTPHVVYNLGNQQPVQLTTFVEVLAQALNKPARINPLPCPPTEVYRTAADTSKLHAAIGWAPHTPLAMGLKNFAAWYATWHKQQA